MKNLLLKFKGWFGSFTDHLVKHKWCVYMTCLLSVIFMFLWMRIEVDRTIEVFQLQKKNIELTLLIKDQNYLLKDQLELIEFQSEVLSSQRKALEKQGTAIDQQENLLRRLVEYLKSVGHWPPKPLPAPDPSKWITCHEEEIGYIR